jgi:cation transport regulator ChaC
MSLAVFAYGSLVSAPSAALTLGRGVIELQPATLRGWRRGFTLVRDNRACEKTFARSDDDSIPDLVLALNLEAGEAADAVNGALLTTDEEELARLDRRENRYRRVEVGNAIAGTAAASFERVFTYVARPEHHAPAMPAGAIILTTYAGAVEAAFAGLGPGELDRYRETTAACAAERVDAYLVAGEIPAGNPRSW